MILLNNHNHPDLHDEGEEKVKRSKHFSDDTKQGVLAVQHYVDGEDPRLKEAEEVEITTKTVI